MEPTHPDTHKMYTHSFIRFSYLLLVAHDEFDNEKYALNKQTRFLYVDALLCKQPYVERKSHTNTQPVTVTEFVSTEAYRFERTRKSK